MSALTLVLAVALANAPANATTNAAQSARITSDVTYYDRKEGLAVFKGHVHVDDADYQLHAERAFVFMNASNELSRIAAKGGVALTNGTKRAYGDKVTYYREGGLVVLHGAEGKPAVVRDEAPGGDRTVSGSKIRFWINREQVEVLESELTAPRPKGGAASLALPGIGQKKKE